MLSTPQANNTDPVREFLLRKAAQQGLHLVAAPAKNVEPEVLRTFLLDLAIAEEFRWRA